MAARRSLWVVSGTVLLFALFAVNSRAGGEPETGPENGEEQTLFRGMPDDVGRIEVFGFCGSCHSIELVLQQGLSRAVWDDVLDEMVEDQEMAPLQADIRVKILDYLEEYYGPDRKARKEASGNEGVPSS